MRPLREGKGMVTVLWMDGPLRKGKGRWQSGKVAWRADFVPNSWWNMLKRLIWRRVRERKWPGKRILSLTLGGKGRNG